MLSLERRLPADTTEAALLALIAKLNAQADVHGILVQLPLPAHVGPMTVACLLRNTLDAARASAAR